MTKKILGNSRQSLRFNIKNRILQKGSWFLEDLLVDNEHRLRDYLKNSLFSERYFLFLEEIKLPSIFFHRSKVNVDLLIPVRGQKSILAILPLPWDSESYSTLEAEVDRAGVYDQQYRAGEFTQSLLPTRFSGLVVDVREERFFPSLVPRIYSSGGKLLYGPEFISKQVGITRGIAGFTQDSEEITHKARTGGHPMLTVAVGVRGKNNTDVVISLKDAQKYFDHRENVLNMKKCRVLFLFSKKSFRNFEKSRKYK